MVWCSASFLVLIWLADAHALPGVMYFVFMLRWAFLFYCPTWLLTCRYLDIGILNVILSLSVSVGIFDHHDNKFTDMFILEGFANTIWVYNVSHDGCQPVEAVQRWSCRFRLQTMMHSILSTRIVLHTGRVLRQDVAHTRLPTNMGENGRRIRPDPDEAVESERLERIISGTHEDLWVHTIIVRVARNSGGLDPTANKQYAGSISSVPYTQYLCRSRHADLDLVRLQCNY